ncbi:MAG: VanZ family protein [Anaerolineales bacterium]
MKWLAILFGLFILTIIVLADLGKLGFIYFIYSFKYGDKVGHFILYGILTLLIDLALFRSSAQVDSVTVIPSRKRISVTVGFILAFAITLEEFSQQYFSKRTFDLIDLSASFLGVIFFSWLALKIVGRD